MKLETIITPLDPQTFEYQTYDASDERLIVQSNLDTAFTSSTDYIEYYIYDQNQTLIYPSTTVPLAEYNVKEGDVLLNPELNLESRGFDIGTYNILYTFYRKHLSSTPVEKYFISEISSDRTEIRLDSNEIDNALIISSSNSFIQYRENSEYFIDFYLNFGENQTLIANNLKLEEEEGIDPTLLVKLYEPLPNTFNLKDELWVVEELSHPQLYKVVFPFNPIIEDDFTYLAGPNYSLNISQQTATPSSEFSYNTLINSNITSSINQIQSLLNEKEININVDYENYGNFVNFSSAKTRLENFYYKVGLIESASNELEDFYGLVTSNTINQTFFSASTATINNQINNIIKNFDGYEYFLYFNSGSLYSYPKSNTEPPFQLYSTGSTEVLTWLGNVNPDNLYYGGQALSASNYDENNRDWLYWSIPEYLRDDNDNVGYELFVDMVGQYYDNVWAYTKDITNKFSADNRLDYGISKDLVADAIRDFSVKLYSNNFNTDDLFTAFLGITPSGSSFPVTGITGSLPTPTGYEYVDTKISASNDIIPLNDINKRLYKRIYHNIPYLLKTKGTVAGLRALITSYGIPDTILRINEFGGKDRNNSQDWDLKQNVFNYAFDTGEDSDNFITSSFNPSNDFNPSGGTASPGTVQFRFKSAPIPTGSNNQPSPDIRDNQLLWLGDRSADASFNTLGAAVVLEYTGSGFTSGSYSGSIASPYDTWGTLKFYPDLAYNSDVTCSVFAPFFNGDWWSVQLTYTGSGVGGASSTVSASLFAANKVDGKVGFNGSETKLALDSRSWIRSNFAALNLPANRTINSTVYQPFSGAFQEYRMFVPNVVISESKFFDYTLNPYSNEGNTINSTPDELMFRAALGSQLSNDSTILGIPTNIAPTSIHPRVTGSAVQITQSFSNGTSDYFTSLPSFKGERLYVENKEFIYQDQVVAGMKNRITEKVILKNNDLAEAPYGYNFNNPDIDGDVLASQGIITSSALSSMRSLQTNSFTSQSYTPNVDYLEVAFSPTNQINDDINAQLGYFNIGDYIGDPRFISSSDYSYPDLDRLRNAYFEKYMDSYNVVDFIRLIKFFDNSLFKMIKDFTPARTSLASGIVIKQHILERNRQRPAQITSSNETLTGLVSNLPKNYSTGSLDYPQYSNSGSAIYKFSGGPGGVVNKWNGLQTSPSGFNGNGPDNRFGLTQSYDVTGTARDPYGYSIINSTLFNYSSSQFLSASYQGLGVENVSTQHEFYDGEFSGSNIVATTQSLNATCGSYLKVVDRGILFNPIFYNGQMSTGFTTTNQGTVDLDTFNDPNNEPLQGDAWIYSQHPTNPTILLSTGANPNVNYIHSIKLSRIDIEGNDVTDYIQSGTDIQLILPDSNIFGGGVATYKILGIIPEANSVRLRIALEYGSNRYWTTSTVLNTSYRSTIDLTPDSIGESVFLNAGSQTNSFPNVSHIRYFNIGNTGQNNTAFFEDLNTQGGIGELQVSYGGYIYNFEITNTSFNPSTYTEFEVTPTTTTSPNGVLPAGNTNSIQYKLSLSATGEIYFPITSSANGGTENWSFKIDTSYTSSNFRTGSTDLWQQNTFKNTSELTQTQYITAYTDKDKSTAFPPEYNSPSINSITPNQWYGPSGGSGNGSPLFLGYYEGVNGQYLAAGMLNPISQQIATYDIWNYSAYTLTKTPNVPLNFQMDIYYSASDEGTGGGIITTTQQGNLHNGQGYNPLIAGNRSQAIGFSGIFLLNVSHLKTSFGTSDGRHATVTEALNAYTGSQTYTDIYTPSYEIFGFFNVLYSNPSVTAVFDGFIAEPYETYYTLIHPTTNALVGVGSIREDSYNYQSPTFRTIWNSNGNYVYAISAPTVDSRVNSGKFTPSTFDEGVSSPLFQDNFNPLIPGNSGSAATGSSFANAGGHPRMALNGTASLDYNFGTLMISGSPVILNNIIDAPFSGSALFPDNSNWGSPTGNANYWGQDNSDEDGAFNISPSNFNNFQTLCINSLPENAYGGNFSFIRFDPNWSFSMICFAPTGSTFNATASVEYQTSFDDDWVTIDSTLTTPTLLSNTLSIISNPTGSGNVVRNIYSIDCNNRTSNNQDPIPGFLSYKYRLKVESNQDFIFYMTEWDVEQVVMKFQYYNNTFNQTVLGNYSATNTNGTFKTTGLGSSGDLQYYVSPSNVNQIQAGSVDIQAFLKYTGSINDGTENGQVVDIVLTSSSQDTYTFYPGVELNISASASSNGFSPTGVNFYNPLPYDSSTNASSSLNLAGGMYYLEYSMSNFDNNFGPILTDFLIPNSQTQRIGITQSAKQGISEVEDPKATIYPNIYYGNTADKTTFGNPMQWISGEIPEVANITTSSVGFYSFSGSFFPRDETNGFGWNIGDTFRMGNTVEKTGGNIGVVITSASFQISPGTSEYAPITESPNLGPNVYRVPTTTEFIVPTFYENGVLPFSFAVDCQPLLNNYNQSRPSKYLMDIDYNDISGPIIPVNQSQILENRAIRASTPDSNYSTAGWTLPRYKGSRSTCNQINIFTYGDKGTYGQLPNIESRLAYFAYFESITNPYPLYNNATQLNMAYLIDEQENALPPSLNGQSYEIMNVLYPQNSQVSIQINSGSNIIQELNGFHNIKSVGQRYEPICFTQTSSQGYTNEIPLSGSGRISIYDNAGNAEAKTIYGVSVMGSGVTNVDEQAAIRGSNFFNAILAPSDSVVTASYNNASTELVGFPYLTSSGQFFFSSSIDDDSDNSLVNPQTIFVDTTVHTSFIYENGDDEMAIKIRCVLERDGNTSQIPFELEDVNATAYYLGQSRVLGSVLGSVENGGGWRSGIMVQFIGPTGGESTAVVADASNQYFMKFENPVVYSLLVNRGVNWWPHGGVENGGPVEYIAWNIKANTGGFIFNALDKVHFEVEGIMFQRGNDGSALNKFYPQGYDGETYLPTNFSVIGASDSAIGDNTASAPYWEFTGSNERDYIEMASPNFNEAYGSAWTQGYLPYEAGPSQFFEGGFEPTNTKFPRIKKPLEFKINDEIRFLNNETYTYTIIEVFPPQENINSSGVGKVKLKLNKEVNGSINKNFFLIRRPSDDSTIAYIDEDFPYIDVTTSTEFSGSNYSSPGLILPEFPSEYINISSSQIINNLISKGVIKS